MAIISHQYLLENQTPSAVWSRLSQAQRPFLPLSFNNASFNHVQAIDGGQFGFELAPPWELFPADDWRVSVQQTMQQPVEKVAYSVEIALSDKKRDEKLYSADLEIMLKPADGGTQIEITIDGRREAGLAPYSDDLVETIIRSQIREGWQDLDRLFANGEESDPAQTEPEYEPDHTAPLAIAAGVFSAGMALGLWLWRRKRKNV